MIRVMQGDVEVGVLGIPDSELPKMGDELVLTHLSGAQETYRVLRVQRWFNEHSASWGEEYFVPSTLETIVQVESY